MRKLVISKGWFAIFAIVKIRWSWNSKGWSRNNLNLCGEFHGETSLQSGLIRLSPVRVFWRDFCRMMWSWFLFYYERHIHMVIHMYISCVYYMNLCDIIQTHIDLWIKYVCYTFMPYTFHCANLDHLCDMYDKYWFFSSTRNQPALRYLTGNHLPDDIRVQSDQLMNLASGLQLFMRFITCEVGWNPGWSRRDSQKGPVLSVHSVFQRW